MAASAMLDAAGGRAGDAGQRGDGDGLVDQRVGDGIAQRAADDLEARQRGDDGAEAVLRRGVEGRPAWRRRRPRCAPGEAPSDALVGQRDDGRDADDQRALDGPDGRRAWRCRGGSTSATPDRGEVEAA